MADSPSTCGRVAGLWSNWSRTMTAAGDWRDGRAVFLMR
jgi:hypothetical protein